MTRDYPTMCDDSALNSPHLIPLLQETVHQLVDSCLMDGIMSMHRAIKLGYFHVIAPELPKDDDEEGSCNPASSVVRSGNNGHTGGGGGRDSASKAAGCCRCVKCHSKVAATRFAPHLSNCMGLGRNSSRRANKRIAEQQRLEDYDDDLDDLDYKQDYYPTAPSVAATSSSSSLHTSASDSAITRLANGASHGNSAKHQTQHSPLKLTIALVPSSGKTETGTKHVIRTSVNGAAASCETGPSAGLTPLRLAQSTGTRGGGQQTSVKQPLLASNSTVISAKGGDVVNMTDLVLNEAKVELTKQDFNFNVVRRD